MKVRKYVRLVHRDLGYIVFGLIIVYAISGIAVNHVSEWNPNYIIARDTVSIPVMSDTIKTKDALEKVLPALGKIDSVTGMFRRSKIWLDVFYDGKTASARLTEGYAVVENINDRRIFRESNFLHLNTPKKAWTYVADAFAVALAILAITGLFMIRGKKGITGRGKWLVAFGILIPLSFLLIYFY